MKNLRAALITLSICFLSVTVCRAQIFTADKTIRGNSAIFKTISISKDSFVVVNTENELFNQTAKLSKYPASLFKKKPAYVMYQTFTAVFSTNRLRQLNSENALVVNYYVNSKGEVLEVTFTLRNISQLTAVELEKLENEIERNISFIIPKNKAKGENLFIITDAVQYRRILDRTIY
ncbi:hypothetical protein [Mucilaginibacter sp.]|jgi:hypothetical protein|uniref:hypothetical protein n=1 Tax=Mucilaginibacter sp. TaxID=1882438 RepID=UPI003563019F